ncbi:MAG: hypothetical protein HY738_05165, partial [Bacteroidia bacterium]|nr:hypothetical protein [Bacteroidia bacterium]
MQKPKKTKNQLNQKKSPTIKLQPQAPQKGKLKSMAKKEKRFPWLVYFSAVIVLVLTLLCYSQVHKNGFTNWDDPGYVTESETIDKGLTWNNIKIIFSKPQVSNYHPLTILSLTIDYEISKKYFSLPDNKPVPTIFHLTNLIFHLLATLMVFIFIYHLTHKKLLISIIVSALFGIHPMHVESVAWISEKKDVLYGFFFVAALFTYVKYYKTKKILYFVLTFFLFILSILSKPAGIVFPFVLMLVDFSLNENIIIRNFKELYFSFINYFQNKCYLKSRTWEKIFLLFFALAELYITYKIQENKAVADFDTFTVWQRFMFASYGFIMYINKLFVPVKLTTFYPYPNLDEHGYIPLIFYVSPFIVLGFLVLIYLTMKRTKAAIWGIIFYFITVALVLQFISVGRAIMSDRYTYIPYIGLFFIIGYYYDFVIQLKTKYSLVLKLIFSLALVGWGIYLYTSAYERV